MMRSKKCQSVQILGYAKLFTSFSGWGRRGNYARPFERLRQESRVSKEKQDTGTINNLMDITWPHRRHFLITDMEKLSKVIDLYPILCEEQQVCFECKTWRDCALHIVGMFDIFLCSNKIKRYNHANWKTSDKWWFTCLDYPGNFTLQIYVHTPNIRIL